MKLHNHTKLIISILLPILAGVLGSLFTFSGMSSWYEGLVKPAFNPPGWLFAPVWTGLYVLMGCALYYIWVDGERGNLKRKAIFFFIIQLILNALWSIIFFGLKNPTLAFVELIILLAAVVLTTHHFYKLFKPAAWLLVPYTLWLLFAGYLNLGIILLN